MPVDMPVETAWSRRQWAELNPNKPGMLLPTRTIAHNTQAQACPDTWNYEYQMVRSQNNCIPDATNKAWAMLFQSETWPPSSRVT